MNKSHLKHVSALGILVILVLIPVITYSTATVIAPPNSNTTDDVESSSIVSTSAIDPTPTIKYSPDGKGYLKPIGSNKYLLHVEGSPYEMGYQHGYLLASGVSEMASKTFFYDVISSFLSIDINNPDDTITQILTEPVLTDLLGWLLGEDKIKEIFEDGGSILEILVEIVKLVCQLNLKYVPAEIISEMYGLVDGANAAGSKVSFGDVLLLNMAFDAILSIVYPIITPLLPILEGLGILHMCNAFVAQGGATSDGRTIMGRDFMFSGNIFHKNALLIEQVPTSGNKFVSTSAAGFVGVTAAMNSKGIGIGMDMCPSVDCTPGDYGMGCLLTARYVIQRANELSEAVNIIQNSKRGVSWIYPIGDGRTSQRGGVALEVSAHYCYPRYTDYKKPWWMPQVYSQIENKNDLVTIANHFIRTEINVLSLSYAIKDSIWRYETLTNLALSIYGKIDVTNGKSLIDFLHPPNYGYYGDDTTQPVSSSKSCWDLTNLEIWALYGHYNDPWAHYSISAA
jgi:hypothetical protein